MSEPTCIAMPTPEVRCTCREWMRRHGYLATSEDHPNPRCPYAARPPKEGRDEE